jgi:hypothetical protein
MNKQALLFVVAMEGVILICLCTSSINFLARTNPQPRFRHGRVQPGGAWLEDAGYTAGNTFPLTCRRAYKQVQAFTLLVWAVRPGASSVLPSARKNFLTS